MSAQQKKQDILVMVKQIESFCERYDLLPQGVVSEFRKGSIGSCSKLELSNGNMHPCYYHQYGYLGQTVDQTWHTLKGICGALDAIEANKYKLK